MPPNSDREQGARNANGCVQCNATNAGVLNPGLIWFYNGRSPTNSFPNEISLSSLSLSSASPSSSTVRRTSKFYNFIVGATCTCVFKCFDWTEFLFFSFSFLFFDEKKCGGCAVDKNFFERRMMNWKRTSPIIDWLNFEFRNWTLRNVRDGRIELQGSFTSRLTLDGKSKVLWNNAYVVEDPSSIGFCRTLNVKWN